MFFSKFFSLINVLLFLLRSELFPFSSDFGSYFSDGTCVMRSPFVREKNVRGLSSFGFDREEEFVFDDGPVFGSIGDSEGDSVDE